MHKGITLIELLVVIAILGILASAAMPFSRMVVKRTKEIELRGNIRVLRTAIDEFKKDTSKKYLRRIPRDPMTPLDSPGKPNNWGLHSYGDEPDSHDWGGGNVYDVYSKSEKVSLDGTKYNTW